MAEYDKSLSSWEMENKLKELNDTIENWVAAGWQVLSTMPFRNGAPHSRSANSGFMISFFR